MASFHARLGESIRARRLELGISQEELGEIVHLDRTYISGVERGVRNPTIDSLAGIAKGLKCALSELIADAES